MEDKKINNILNQSLDQIMSDRFGRYSKYIIQQRALPDARDGLKPVQRRIIFAMNELGLFSDKAFKKSARIVGEVIGKYHPHGDSSIYEAMVRMAQDWKMNVPLIDMHGNKGSIDDDPAAAMRYTETRLTKISKTLLLGINKKTVSFSPNFDDSEIEPTVLPSLFPNLIVNGARGIASGYATEMPPHNLSEVIKAIIEKIKNPNITLKQIMKYIKGPDFPTGGEIQGKEGILNAFEKGQGKIIIRSKYRINNSIKNPFIEITEVPYGVVKSRLVREIDEKRFNKSVSGIKDVRDETDRNGISIMIELTSGTNPELILNYLLSKTSLQVYYNYNNVAIVNNGPKLMGMMDLIDAYLKHQKEIRSSEIKFDLKKDNIRLEIIEGLIQVGKMSEDVIDLIRNSEGSKKGVVKALIKTFNFTKLQAESIAELRLYRLSRNDQSIYIEEKNNLIKRVEKYNSILNNPEIFNNYLINLLKDFRKEFSTKRKTQVTDEIQKIEINMEDLIKHEDVWIGFSKQGYIKRISNRSFQSNDLNKYSLKDNDFIIFLKKINTFDKLLVFTSKGKYITIPVHLIKELKWKHIGKHINDFASIEVDEKIINVIAVNDFNLDINLVSVSKKGKAKRTKLIKFSSSRYSKSMYCMKLEEQDEMISMKASNGCNHIIVISSEGKAVKYLEKQIPIQGINSKGVKAISLENNSFVINMVIVNSKDIIGMISNRGLVKKIKVENILTTSRISYGKNLYKWVKSNPNVVIDAEVINPETKIVFKDFDQSLKIFKFKIFSLTTTNEGFSNLTKIPNNMGGKIFRFKRINKNSCMLKNIEKYDLKNDKKTSQLSIDDILNKK